MTRSPRRALRSWRRSDADVGRLRRQLVITTAALGTLAAVALVLVVQVVLSISTSDASSTLLEDRADAVVSSVATATDGRTLVVPDARLDPGIAVYDAGGALVGGEVPPSQADRFALLSTVTSPTTEHVGDAYEILGRPFRTSSGARGVVVISESLAPFQDQLHDAVAVSIAAGGVIVVLATVLVAWASRRALEPVRHMARTADAWSEQDLERRFDLGPPTNEIRALGHTLDGLLDKVAHAITAEQRLTSELAHELRTPLTAILGTAELMAARDDLDPELREDVDAVIASCRTMAATITSLLDLARSQGSGAGETCRVVDAVADAVGPVDHGSVGVDLDPDVRLAVPRALAARAIAPVVENAVHLARRVEISARVDGSVVEVLVADDGPGVDGSSGDVFAPGVSGRHGSGLGLALARRIARSNGGDVVVVPADSSPSDLPGATFAIRLPLA